MALRDILKGISARLGINIEGDLFKYAPKSSGSFHAKKVRAGTIVIGDVYIMGPDNTHLMLESGNAEEIKNLVKMNEKEVGGFTRADLAGHDMLALGTQEENRYLLQGLKDIIGLDDLSALSAALAIKKHELLGYGPKAGELRRSLRTRFGERGNRIYVFYGSGLLERFMLPLIEYIEYAGTWSDKLAAKNLWNACLEHMDYAVFVNSRMTADEVVSEILIRFRVDMVPVVFLFGRTSGINKKIRASVKRFIEEEREYQLESRDYVVEETEYEIGDYVSLVVVVRRKQTGK
ncbi:MAG: hypothetical protein KJ653_09730 [Candidatus Thermoplasmatota archaeon]|nr:hypothetical protein [Candidatus Thermoplasmatota archaeon]